jgi:hypothetical protein
MTNISPSHSDQHAYQVHSNSEPHRTLSIFTQLISECIAKEVG